MNGTMLQSLESDERKQEVGEFLQELSWVSRNSNVLIEKGIMFWRERNQLSKPMDAEEDSVLLITLWDKALMRQTVLSLKPKQLKLPPIGRWQPQQKAKKV